MQMLHFEQMLKCGREYPFKYVYNLDTNIYKLGLIGLLAYEKLYEALNQKSLVKAIKQASPVAQTSFLEGYHSVVNQFAPKMLAY